MNHMELMKCVLLLVFVSSVCEAVALPTCRWARYKQLSEKSKNLLERMGGQLPQECLEGKNRSFPSFPKDVFIKAQNEDLVLVALETLSGVKNIFKNNHTLVKWESNSLAFFRSLVFRQVINLQECAGKKVQTSMEKPADSSTATLRSFFEKLEERLKEKEFSSCAWEIVRTELQGGLEALQTVLESRN
nr:interferon phi b1 [Ictalurus punctatus]